MVSHFRDWLGEAHAVDFAFETGQFAEALVDRSSGAIARPGARVAAARRILRERDAPPDAGPRRARSARTDRRDRRHRHPHQHPRPRPPVAGRATRRPRHPPSGGVQPGRQGRAGARAQRATGRAACSSTICRCTTPRSPSMRPRSTACTWSPSRCSRRPSRPPSMPMRGSTTGRRRRPGFSKGSLP